MKHIKQTVVIIACCTVLFANAKQVGKKTEPITQPQPAPINYPQPKPAPITQPKPQPKPSPYYPQSQTGPTYTDILYSLQKKTPDSSDFSTLNNIIHEAERQKKQIQASVEKKPTPQTLPSTNTNTASSAHALMRGEAGKLVNTYRVPLQVSAQHIHDSYFLYEDLFSMEEQQQQINAVYKIVEQFLQQYPKTDKATTVDIIFLAITQNTEYINLSGQIRKTLKEDSGDMEQSVKEIIKNTIKQAWDDYHQK